MGTVLDDIITHERVPLDKNVNDDQLSASSSYTEEKGTSCLKNKMNMSWEKAIKRFYPSEATHRKYKQHIKAWLKYYKGNEKKAS